MQQSLQLQVLIICGTTYTSIQAVSLGSHDEHEFPSPGPELVHPGQGRQRRLQPLQGRLQEQQDGLRHGKVGRLTHIFLFETLPGLLH